MNKSLLSIAVLGVLTLTSFNARAQHSYAGVRAGVRLGTNLANELTTLPSGFSHSVLPGWQGGLEYEYVFNAGSPNSGASPFNGWGLDAQVLFNQKGVHSNFQDINSFHESGTEDWVLNYLEIPVLLTAHFGNQTLGERLFAGPSVGFFLSGKDVGKTEGSMETTSSINSADLRSPDISALFGAGLSSSFGSGYILSFDAAYALGLTNIDRNAPIEKNPTIRSRDIRLSMGILFPLSAPEAATR